jgi:hypothetical protein
VPRERYIRFVTDEIDDETHRRRGIFQVAIYCQEDNETTKEDAEALSETLKWFDGELKKPDRFSKSQKTFAASNAICWFRSTANNHIAKVRELCRLVEKQGIRTEMLTTTKPGYIVYEDEHQIVAVPFKETVS